LTSSLHLPRSSTSATTSATVAVVLTKGVLRGLLVVLLRPAAHVPRIAHTVVNVLPAAPDDKVAAVQAAELHPTVAVLECLRFHQVPILDDHHRPDVAVAVLPVEVVLQLGGDAVVPPVAGHVVRAQGV